MYKIEQFCTCSSKKFQMAKCVRVIYIPVIVECKFSACSVGWFVSLLVHEEVLLAGLCEKKNTVPARNLQSFTTSHNQTNRLLVVVGWLMKNAPPLLYY